MAHELDIRNGKASIAYAGAEPWHGLGQHLSAGADLETWAVEAGMAWEVLRSPVTYADQLGQLITEPRRHVLFRSDTGEYLNTVSDRFSTEGVQPMEVLEFFRSYTEERGYTMETAGVLFGGQRYWALARTPNEVAIGGGDLVRQYLLLATGLDGFSTQAKYVNTRVVCNNTITAADRERGGAVVRHSHRSAFKAESVKAELAAAEEGFKAWGAQAARLADRRVTTGEVVEYLARVLKVELPTEKDLAAGRGTLIELANKFAAGAFIGADLPGSAGTAWGLCNVVTEYVDHHKGGDANYRLHHAWFGNCVDLKLRAFQEAAALAATKSPARKATRAAA